MPKNQKTRFIAVTYGAAYYVKKALEKEAEHLRKKYRAEEQPSTLDLGYFREIAEEMERSAAELGEFCEEVQRGTYPCGLSERRG